MKRLIRNRLTIPWTPFYRQYPYRNGISINSADARGLVDFELGVFCSRIPKAANSSIIVNLAYHRFGHEVPSKEAKKRFTTPSALSRQQVEQLPSLFTFAFVRNPYTRVLSAFLDKVDRRARRRNDEVSFLEFLRNLEQKELYSNAHWAPQRSLLLQPLENFDFIGKTEHLDRDLSHVIDQLRVPVQDHSIRSALGNATGASGKLQSYFDDTTKAIVDRLYQEDFESFDYPMTLPEPKSRATADPESVTAAQEAES